MDGLETPTKNPIAQNAALRSPPDQLLLFPFMFLTLISPEKNETLFLYSYFRGDDSIRVTI